MLCAAVLVLIAPFDATAERLPIKTYTAADGLAHNDVTRIVKDSRGFLWFCTADGLSRFDGYTFTNFGPAQGLPHSFVNDLLETRGGEYWVATNGGLVHFDPKGRPGSRVVYENDSTTPAPMFTVVVPDDEDRRGSAINVLREGRDGTIWAGTDNGLYRLEQTNGRRSLRPIEIRLPHDYAGTTRHRGRAGGCARLVVDRDAERPVSPLARRDRGTLHRARWSAERTPFGRSRRSRGTSLGGNTPQRLLRLQRRCHSQRPGCRPPGHHGGRSADLLGVSTLRDFRPAILGRYRQRCRGVCRHRRGPGPPFSSLHRKERLELSTTSPRSTKTSAAICGWARTAPGR